MYPRACSMWPKPGAKGMKELVLAQKVGGVEAVWILNCVGSLVQTQAEKLWRCPRGMCKCYP